MIVTGRKGDFEHEVIGRAIDDGDEFLYQKCCQLYRSYEKLLNKMQAIKFTCRTFNNSAPEEIRSVTKTRITEGREANAEEMLEYLDSDASKETYLRKVDLLLTEWDKYCDGILRQVVQYAYKHGLFRDDLYESTDGEVTEILLTHGERGMKAIHKKKRSKKKKGKK